MIIQSKAWDRGFNTAILHIADKLTRGRWQPVASYEAPSTLAELKDRIATDKFIPISAGFSDKTIYDDREVNYAFRAWHDWCHWKGNHEFNISGEEQVALMQHNHLKELYGRETAERWWPLLDAEVNGQANFNELYGRFPKNQALFDRRYIREMHPDSEYVDAIVIPPVFTD